jgi:hypothetical protein
VALALEKIHAVEAEGFDFDESLCTLGNGFWEGRVNEEGRDGAFAVFDFYREEYVRPTISSVA